MTGKKTRAVVVTTEFRGVFFGYLDSEKGNTVRLRDARNCLSWTSKVRGFMGLARTGPADGCRIGPSVPAITLYKVTSILDCTTDAEAAWKREIW